MTKGALGDHLPQFLSQRMHWPFEWWIQKWLLMTQSYPGPVTGPQPEKLLFPPRPEFPPYTHIVTHDQVTQGHEGETSCLLRGWLCCTNSILGLCGASWRPSLLLPFFLSPPHSPRLPPESTSSRYQAHPILVSGSASGAQGGSGETGD